jgi:betaine lipid synthase
MLRGWNSSIAPKPTSVSSLCTFCSLTSFQQSIHSFEQSTPCIPHSGADDAFRSRFLWGRKPMLAACAARLHDQDNLVWVDLGGGTGENVALMADYLPLSQFKHIYVVDLCASLCDQARKKVADAGWTNVTVVQADACEWCPPNSAAASLVTFSYSLSMIPPFYAAVDRAISYLDPEDGLLGVCDFFTPSKFDLPMRQLGWARRFFWRAVFDTDNIDVGPERRQYLDHQLSRVWEFNDADTGSIPWVPVLRAPYYVWIGRVPKLETLLVENRVEAPALFPPTFLYTQSWEDPGVDEEVLNVGPEDTCLTLTSGGCNSLNLCLQGAKSVRHNGVILGVDLRACLHTIQITCGEPARVTLIHRTAGLQCGLQPCPVGAPGAEASGHSSAGA